MAFRRVPIGRGPIRQSHDVGAEEFGEAPPEIEFTRDDVAEFDATEELPDALAQLREVSNSAHERPLKLDPPIRGMIGKSITLQPNQEEAILDWQVVDDESAVPVTILIAPPNVSTPLPVGFEGSGIMTGFATVDYGIGGSQNSLVLDILPGNVITLPATFIRVKIKADATNTLPLPISAFICRFPINHPPAKRTLEHVNIPNPGSSTRPIPTLSRTVQGIPNDPAAGAYRIELLDANANVLDSETVAAGAKSTVLNIPGNAIYVRITNTAGAPITGPALIFELF